MLAAAFSRLMQIIGALVRATVRWGQKIPSDGEEDWDEGRHLLWDLGPVFALSLVIQVSVRADDRTFSTGCWEGKISKITYVKCSVRCKMYTRVTCG